MQATFGTVVGIIIGVVLILVLGKRIDPERPSALAWTALGLGIVSTVVVGLGLLGIGEFGIPAVLTIPLGFAAIIAAVGAFVKRDRHWPTWAALVVGGLPALFWIFFFVAEIVTPHG